MAASDTRPTVNAKTLISVLKVLPPGKSVLLIGPHGIGKSQISAAIAAHFGMPCIDRRLAQMTEGDMIGLPVMTDDITRFLPVDWFKKGCKEPVLMLLDELNRATMEIMNAAFQIVLDREMNGNTLHEETRVIACVNAGAHYSVNEMDPALINRFAIFNFEPDVEDWKTWARGAGIDPVLVDFIHHNPKELREKDLDTMEPMTAYPTPRGWEAVDECLKHAGMAPKDCAGKAVPDLFHPIVTSLVGAPTSVAFCRFVKQYQRVVSAADVLDNWEQKKGMLAGLSHDEVVAVLDKIGEHCKKNRWTPQQAENLVKFAESKFTGEDYLTLFKYITGSKNVHNIRLVHNSKATEKIMTAVNRADAMRNNR